jgi:transcriptional regulator with XRE-family HTH domain
MKENNLKEYRKKQCISQLKLSYMANIAPGTISNIENGKIYVYPGWKKRISEALKIPESVLFPD